ncbi:LOW QUALITY PROTEIN: spermatogenesis-associated protein 20 [Pristis pectinata]|uniref:LOW QUALITY PROTEIN: spermatogenesis-associated protein 20 n=1 Tax=Pristis pectinata TaxID=685728 RepID=UPI00223D028F|nr:LOW QUALITY PROTEIN: spermatogenesis-associated protein 20 [Pristis pectinata]
MLRQLGCGSRFPLSLRRAASSIRSAAGDGPGGLRAGARHRNHPRRSLVRTIFITMATGGSEEPPSSLGQKKHTNRLIHEKSPYLLQHAHNPVDWYPWGPEAFAKAKAEDKPVFLSVGYSTCHWCHVMERESFENEEIGKIMNENFVCIKVDREERPDVDKVYMMFVQATSGGGGWPMSVWLTPDLEPFVGGTYFAPEDGSHRPGFKTVLKNLADQWKKNRSGIIERGNKILVALQRGAAVSSDKEGVPPSCPQVMEKCFQQLSHSYDDEYGGFNESPKFPSPANFNFLFRVWALNKTSANGARALEMALHTLKMMALGGIHDHIGQGFHRYSTDRHWQVPHFEKMLYDQAQLAVSYTDAYQIAGDTFFADVARDILLYVSRDLSDKSGGFYSAEDADSHPSANSVEKKEGAFCVWTEQEIRELLPDPVSDSTQSITMADVFAYHYGVKGNGNVEPAQDLHGELKNKNVLIVRHSPQLTATKFGLDVEKVNDILSTCRNRLCEVRKQRPRPHLDSKMVASWNGLMISGFARAGAVLGEKAYIRRAAQAAAFLKEHMFDLNSGQLLRSCYRGGENVVEQGANPISGFLDDYAFVIRGLIDLYEASFEEQWLEWALKLQQKQDELFWDAKEFGYFTDDARDPSVLIRLKEDQDGAEPSGNAVAASNLVRLANFTNQPDWTVRSKQIMTAFEKLLSGIPVALPEMVIGLMVQHHHLKQVVIRGELEAPDTQELIECINAHFVPNKILLLADGNSESFLYQTLPFLSTLELKDGKATAYVCQNFSCSLPVTSAAELKTLLIK